jgi:hypothetical protein
MSVLPRPSCAPQFGGMLTSPNGKSKGVVTSRLQPEFWRETPALLSAPPRIGLRVIRRRIRTSGPGSATWRSCSATRGGSPATWDLDRSRADLAPSRAHWLRGPPSNSTRLGARSATSLLHLDRIEERCRSFAEAFPQVHRSLCGLCETPPLDWGTDPPPKGVPLAKCFVALLDGGTAPPSKRGALPLRRVALLEWGNLPPSRRGPLQKGRGSPLDGGTAPQSKRAPLPLAEAR